MRDKLSKDVQIFWDACECEDAGGYESAVKLYQLAITLGSAESCINLGNYYINHHGNNKVAEALTLYAMASDMGHDGGAWNLYNHHKDSNDIISQYWLKNLPN